MQKNKDVSLPFLHQDLFGDPSHFDIVDLSLYFFRLSWKTTSHPDAGRCFSLPAYLKTCHLSLSHVHDDSPTNPTGKRNCCFPGIFFCFANSNWSNIRILLHNRIILPEVLQCQPQSLSFPHGSMRLITYCWIRATASWRAAGLLVATTCRCNAQPWNRARWPISWVEDARGLPKQVIFIHVEVFPVHFEYLWMMFPSFQSKKFWLTLLPNVCHAVSSPWCLRCYFFLVICSETPTLSIRPGVGSESGRILWKDLGKKKKLSKNILPLSPQKSTKKNRYQTSFLLNCQTVLVLLPIVLSAPSPLLLAKRGTWPRGWTHGDSLSGTHKWYQMYG